MKTTANRESLINIVILIITSSNRKLKSAFEFCRIGMLKIKNPKNIIVPELLGRREIGLSPAGARTNELITKHVHT